MNNDNLDDLSLEGGDELRNSEECPHCGAAIYLDQKIDWINEDKKSQMSGMRRRSTAINAAVSNFLKIGIPI